ncbi:MAG: aminopeptidase [Ruminococcaceae bacterium]|nr:aminopeptidase [Oscillospiraceae bacterium]
MSEKTKAQLLAEELLYKKQSAFETMNEEEMANAYKYADEYAEYLYNSKTEREAVATSIKFLEEKGYIEYKLGDNVVVGGKYYLNNRDKALFAFSVGTENINEGVRICAAHIDSPRLDMKPHPLFENDGFGYLKTHYYGGIRKYQWPTLPLALHGVVTKKNGETVEVNIGEDAGDPIFVVTDLLPHLAREQSKTPLGQAFGGECLNIVIGASPLMEDGKPCECDSKIKLHMMKLLNEKYGIIERDFVTAELCAVPAGKPMDIGLDRVLLGGYGHDDKVCAYPALTALTDKTTDTHTVICVLADKEETGSDGVSGMQCTLLAELIDEIAKALGGNGNVCRSRSMCLSADVNAGYDPNYPEVFEKNNAAIVNCGVVMTKYTGSGGKYSTNDAGAEFVGKIRDMFEEDNVLWQSAEMGKIDIGGGGTVAKYVANHNIDTVDLGVPVLSMHAPFEVISKLDLYETYKAFLSFCK